MVQRRTERTALPSGYGSGRVSEDTRPIRSPYAAYGVGPFDGSPRPAATPATGRGRVVARRRVGPVGPVGYDDSDYGYASSYLVGAPAYRSRSVGARIPYDVAHTTPAVDYVPYPGTPVNGIHNERYVGSGAYVGSRPAYFSPAYGRSYPVRSPSVGIPMATTTVGTPITTTVGTPMSTTSMPTTRYPASGYVAPSSGNSSSIPPMPINFSATNGFASISSSPNCPMPSGTVSSPQELQDLFKQQHPHLFNTDGTMKEGENLSTALSSANLTAAPAAPAAPAAGATAQPASSPDVSQLPAYSAPDAAESFPSYPLPPGVGASDPEPTPAPSAPAPAARASSSNAPFDLERSRRIAQQLLAN